MTDFYHSWAPCAKAVPSFRQTTKLKNSGDTILISAAVPLVPPLRDVVRDAGGGHPGNARHGLSTPRSGPHISMSPRKTGILRLPVPGYATRRLPLRATER